MSPCFLNFHLTLLLYDTFYVQAVIAHDATSLRVPMEATTYQAVEVIPQLVSTTNEHKQTKPFDLHFIGYTTEPNKTTILQGVQEFLA